MKKYIFFIVIMTCFFTYSCKTPGGNKNILPMANSLNDATEEQQNTGSENDKKVSDVLNNDSISLKTDSLHARSAN